MEERSPVQLGLIKPPRIFGLPVLYAVLWFSATVLFLLWFQSLIMIIVSLVVYPILWFAADWDENFIEVLGVAFSKTPRTRNRKFWGGNSYAP